MSASQDVVDGILCMSCLTFLISDDGVLCDAGHPLHCSDCWDHLPRSQKRDGAPFFDEKSGQVRTGKEPNHGGTSLPNQTEMNDE
ncbi:MAG: hypothetical protein AAFU85_33750 [Planctomycetota bacterium]